MALAQAEKKLCLQASVPSGLSGRAGQGEPSVEWTPTLHFRGPGPLCPPAVRSRALHLSPHCQSSWAGACGVSHPWVPLLLGLGLGWGSWAMETSLGLLGPEEG